MMMKTFKYFITLFLCFIMCLGLTVTALAKGRTQAHKLCLEGATGLLGAPRARWNMSVDVPDAGGIAKVAGQLILTQGTTNPPLSITFIIKGTYNPKSGDLIFEGKGGGTDNAVYVAKGMVNNKPKSKNGPYVVEYKKVNARKWAVTKGQAVTAPCVKAGANK
jgi:hypothetical protein